MKPEGKLPVLLLFSAEKAQKAEGMHPKKAISFQVHYGHSKGNTPDGEKPKSGNRTLKIEYHSLGHKEDGVAEEANVEWGASPHLPRCIPNPTGVEDK